MADETRRSPTQKKPSPHHQFTRYLRGETPAGRTNGARHNGGPPGEAERAIPSEARSPEAPAPETRGTKIPSPEERGAEAAHPGQIPRAGWKALLGRTWKQIQTHRMLLISGALAFFGLLALFPGLIALVSIYGLVADPADVEAQMATLGEPLPEEAQTLMLQQLQSIVTSAPAGLGLAVAVGILLALWSASSGVTWLMDTLNIAYEEEETRGFARRRGLALLFTLGIILFTVVAIFVITALPAAAAALGLGEAGRLAVSIGRWPILAAFVIAGLAVLYRYGPDRKAPKWRWVTPGALVAAILWLGASLLFSLYVSVAGGFAETYGALGSIIVLLLWLQISALAILVGVELDAQIERQVASPAAA